jgi:hypothetical protein
MDVSDLVSLLLLLVTTVRKVFFLWVLMEGLCTKLAQVVLKSELRDIWLSVFILNNPHGYFNSKV